MHEADLATNASFVCTLLAGALLASLLWLTELPWQRARRRTVALLACVAGAVLAFVVVGAVSNASRFEPNPALFLGGLTGGLTLVALRRSVRQSGTLYGLNVAVLGLVSSMLFWVSHDWSELVRKGDPWGGTPFLLIGLMGLAAIQVVNSLWRKRWSQAALALVAICLTRWFAEEVARHSTERSYVSSDPTWVLAAGGALLVFAAAVIVEGVLARKRRKRQQTPALRYPL